MNQHEHAHDFDWAAMVSFAEADAEVLGAILDEALATVAGLVADDGLDVRRILDVGCGPGVATCALAERFAGAGVVAADGSHEMLANVTVRAARLGIADRVTTRRIDLPEGVDDLGPADLAWASMVLHHVGDESAALRALRAALRTGGLLALVEFGDPLRVVPDDVDLERPGLWGRVDDAYAEWLAGMRAALPGATVSADYPSMLAAAGFDVVVDRIARVHLDPPLDGKARGVAQSYLDRTRRHVDSYAGPADLAALDALLDEHRAESIARRPDAFLHVSRRLLVCRATDR